MNVTSALNSGMLNVNRSQDNTPKAAGDTQGSGRPNQPEMASGRQVNQDVATSTVSQNTAAAATKVVNASGEVLGNLIDTMA
ncbi:MAG: hypothetical protein SVU24_09765 [Pseudomonadota bacterium]|jgi:hypothetical protein|nr:hypothetical protein [Pseudomonadota bacterium]